MVGVNRYKDHARDIFRYLISLYLVLFSLNGLAANNFEHQRELFQQAEQALAAANQLQFSQLLDRLQDYPLRAYLEHDAFKQGLSQADVDEVEEFLRSHEEFPFHYHLLSQWLNILAKREDWTNYLKFYDGRSATRYKCLALTARLNTGQDEGINPEIKSIWLSGYSQPDACDIPFAHFLETYQSVTEVIWLRIEKAFEARRPSLARYLSQKLDAKDQAIVNQWYQAHKNPAQRLPQLAKAKDDMMNRKMIIHALDRLARRDSLAALDHWQQLQQDFKFNQQQKQRIDKRVALSAALQHKAEAKQLLEQLPDEIKSDNAHLWLARIHLRDEDWIGLIRTISHMPDRLSEEAEWVYWLARAYQEAGKTQTATDIFRDLSTRSTYYGFLAADRLGLDYQINKQQVTANIEHDEAQLLASNINLLRARELFLLDRRLEARREWFQGIRKLNTDQIKQAAAMASSWKWHDSAIKTVAKTSHRSDYDLRFPMPYRQQVMGHIETKDLDPSIIYGVMRRESLFDPLAKSRVGALGLMQLMPYTARSVAKSLGLKKPAQADILQVDNNIKLGTSYYRKVLNQFGDNIPLATAAYNAGPKNVRRWLPKDSTMSADLWVETVPFKETRNYVQAVLAYATIFDKHLGQQILISSRMPDIETAYD